MLRSYHFPKYFDFSLRLNKDKVWRKFFYSIFVIRYFYVVIIIIIVLEDSLIMYISSIKIQQDKR